MVIAPGGVLVLTGGEMLLTGPAVRWLATAAEVLSRSQLRNGVRDQQTAQMLAAAIEAAARARVTSDLGSAELPMETVLPVCAVLDPVTTVEAAIMLKTSPRNVVDLCRRRRLITARKVAGRWQIERTEVAERAERMAS